MKLYHMTLAKNVPRIMKKGLMPGCDKVFTQPWESNQPRCVYLGTAAAAFEQVFAEAFPEELESSDLEWTLLEVNIPSELEYMVEPGNYDGEYITFMTIPPKYIKVVHKFKHGFPVDSTTVRLARDLGYKD